MKHITLLFIACFALISCSSQSKEFSIIGKWKEIEYHGSDGSNSFVQEIDNGRTFVFEKSKKVIVIKDGFKVTGNFQLKGDSLKITLQNEVTFYQLNYSNDGNLSLSPRTEDFEIICDEGCTFVFKKTK